VRRAKGDERLRQPASQRLLERRAVAVKEEPGADDRETDHGECERIQERILEYPLGQVVEVDCDPEPAE
jgi:hypothetical protein